MGRDPDRVRSKVVGNLQEESTGSFESKPAEGAGLRLSRKQIGLLPPRAQAKLKTSQGVFLHFSDGYTSKSVENSKKLAREIQLLHMKKGWKDIAYSWLVDDAGNILEGRGWGVVGAHTKGYNSRAHAICYLGKHLEPAKEALESIQRLIKQHDDEYGAGYVACPRDVAKTDSPGQWLSDWVHQQKRPIPGQTFKFGRPKTGELRITTDGAAPTKDRTSAYLGYRVSSAMIVTRAAGAAGASECRQVQWPTGEAPIVWVEPRDWPPIRPVQLEWPGYALPGAARKLKAYVWFRNVSNGCEFAPAVDIEGMKPRPPRQGAWRPLPEFGTAEGFVFQKTGRIDDVVQIRKALAEARLDIAGLPSVATKCKFTSTSARVHEANGELRLEEVRTFSSDPRGFRSVDGAHGLFHRLLFTRDWDFEEPGTYKARLFSKNKANSPGREFRIGSLRVQIGDLARGAQDGDPAVGEFRVSISAVRSNTPRSGSRIVISGKLQVSGLKVAGGGEVVPGLPPEAADLFVIANANGFAGAAHTLRFEETIVRGRRTEARFELFQRAEAAENIALSAVVLSPSPLFVARIRASLGAADAGVLREDKNSTGGNSPLPLVSWIRSCDSITETYLWKDPVSWELPAQAIGERLDGETTKFDLNFVQGSEGSAQVELRPRSPMTEGPSPFDPLRTMAEGSTSLRVARARFELLKGLQITTEPENQPAAEWINSYGGPPRLGARGRDFRLLQKLAKRPAGLLVSADEETEGGHFVALREGSDWEQAATWMVDEEHRKDPVDKASAAVTLKNVALTPCGATGWMRAMFDQGRIGVEASTALGRLMSGAVSYAGRIATTMHPAKLFFPVARSLQNGEGSLKRAASTKKYVIVDTPDAAMHTDPADIAGPADILRSIRIERTPIGADLTRARAVDMVVDGQRVRGLVVPMCPAGLQPPGEGEPGEAIMHVQLATRTSANNDATVPIRVAEARLWFWWPLYGTDPQILVPGVDFPLAPLPQPEDLAYDEPPPGWDAHQWTLVQSEEETNLVPSRDASILARLERLYVARGAFSPKPCASPPPIPAVVHATRRLCRSAATEFAEWFTSLTALSAKIGGATSDDGGLDTHRKDLVESLSAALRAAPFASSSKEDAELAFPQFVELAKLLELGLIKDQLAHLTGPAMDRLRRRVEKATAFAEVKEELRTMADAADSLVEMHRRLGEWKGSTGGAKWLQDTIGPPIKKLSEDSLANIPQHGERLARVVNSASEAKRRIDQALANLATRRESPAAGNNSAYPLKAPDLAPVLKAVEGLAERVEANAKTALEQAREELALDPERRHAVEEALRTAIAPAAIQLSPAVMEMLRFLKDQGPRFVGPEVAAARRSQWVSECTNPLARSLGWFGLPVTSNGPSGLPGAVGSAFTEFREPYAEVQRAALAVLAAPTEGERQAAEESWGAALGTLTHSAKALAHKLRDLLTLSAESSWPKWESLTWEQFENLARRLDYSERAWALVGTAEDYLGRLADGKYERITGCIGAVGKPPLAEGIDFAVDRIGYQFHLPTPGVPALPVSMTDVCALVRPVRGLDRMPSFIAMVVVNGLSDRMQLAEDGNALLAIAGQAASGFGKADTKDLASAVQLRCLQTPFGQIPKIDALVQGLRLEDAPTMFGPLTILRQNVRANVASIAEQSDRLLEGSVDSALKVLFGDHELFTLDGLRQIKRDMADLSASFVPRGIRLGSPFDVLQPLLEGARLGDGKSLRVDVEPEKVSVSVGGEVELPAIPPILPAATSIRVGVDLVLEPLAEEPIRVGSNIEIGSAFEPLTISLFGLGGTAWYSCKIDRETKALAVQGNFGLEARLGINFGIAAGEAWFGLFGGIEINGSTVGVVFGLRMGARLSVLGLLVIEVSLVLSVTVVGSQLVGRGVFRVKIKLLFFKVEFEVAGEVVLGSRSTTQQAFARSSKTRVLRVAGAATHKIAAQDNGTQAPAKAGVPSTVLTMVETLPCDQANGWVSRVSAYMLGESGDSTPSVDAWPWNWWKGDVVVFHADQGKWSFVQRIKAASTGAAPDATRKSLNEWVARANADALNQPPAPSSPGIPIDAPETKHLLSRIRELCDVPGSYPDKFGLRGTFTFERKKNQGSLLFLPVPPPVGGEVYIAHAASVEGGVEVALSIALLARTTSTLSFRTEVVAQPKRTPPTITVEPAPGMEDLRHIEWLADIPARFIEFQLRRLKDDPSVPSSEDQKARRQDAIKAIACVICYFGWTDKGGRDGNHATKSAPDWLGVSEIWSVGDVCLGRALDVVTASLASQNLPLDLPHLIPFTGWRSRAFASRAASPGWQLVQRHDVPRQAAAIKNDDELDTLVLDPNAGEFGFGSSGGWRRLYLELLLTKAGEREELVGSWLAACLTEGYADLKQDFVEHLRNSPKVAVAGDATAADEVPVVTVTCTDEHWGYIPFVEYVKAPNTKGSPKRHERAGEFVAPPIPSTSLSGPVVSWFHDSVDDIQDAGTDRRACFSMIHSAPIGRQGRIADAPEVTVSITPTPDAIRYGMWLRHGVVPVDPAGARRTPEAFEGGWKRFLRKVPMRPPRIRWTHNEPRPSLPSRVVSLAVERYNCSPADVLWHPGNTNGSPFELKLDRPLTVREVGVRSPGSPGGTSNTNEAEVEDIMVAFADVTIVSTDATDTTDTNVRIKLNAGSAPPPSISVEVSSGAVTLRMTNSKDVPLVATIHRSEQAIVARIELQSVAGKPILFQSGTNPAKKAVLYLEVPGVSMPWQESERPTPDVTRSDRRYSVSMTLAEDLPWLNVAEIRLVRQTWDWRGWPRMNNDKEGTWAEHDDDIDGELLRRWRPSEFVDAETGKRRLKTLAFHDAIPGTASTRARYRFVAIPRFPSLPRTFSNWGEDSSSIPAALLPQDNAGNAPVVLAAFPVDLAPALDKSGLRLGAAFLVFGDAYTPYGESQELVLVGGKVSVGSNDLLNSPDGPRALAPCNVSARLVGPFGLAQQPEERQPRFDASLYFLEVENAGSPPADGSAPTVGDFVSGRFQWKWRSLDDDQESKSSGAVTTQLGSGLVRMQLAGKRIQITPSSWLRISKRTRYLVLVSRFETRADETLVPAPATLHRAHACATAAGALELDDFGPPVPGTEIALCVVEQIVNDASEDTDPANLLLSAPLVRAASFFLQIAESEGSRPRKTPRKP